MDWSGTTHAFRYRRGLYVSSGILVMVLAVGILVGVAVDWANPSSSWARGSGGVSTWDSIWMAAVGLLGIWLGIRLLRLGVLQISAGKMTVRGYLRTRTVEVSEIRAFTLRRRDETGNGPRWIVRVGLAGGKGFWIPSFACGSARRPPRPQLAAIVEQVRALLGIEGDDDTDLPVSQGGEQPQDAVPGLPQDGEAELDADGLPVQDQPAKGRTIPGAVSWLITIACPILGAVSLGIAITYQVSHHKLAGHLTGLSIAAGMLAGILVFFLMPLWWGRMEKNKHQGVIAIIVVVGALLGVIGTFTITGPVN